jgi:hypothetical protein
MRRWVKAAALILALGGCTGGLPEPREIPLAAPTALPAKARVLIHIAQSDLERKFSYQLNSISRQETDIDEGAALQQAAVGLLGRAFAATAVNQVTPRPDVVVRVSGTEVYARVDGTFRVSCGIDAARADGIPLGHFYSAYKSPAAMSLEAALPRVYAQCLKGPVEDLLRSPEFAQLAAAGFPAPDPAVSDGYLRSQGFVVR